MPLCRLRYTLLRLIRNQEKETKKELKENQRLKTAGLRKMTHGLSI